jgi:hypothetical protein
VSSEGESRVSGLDFWDDETSVGVGLAFFLTTTPLSDFLASFFAADRGGWAKGFVLEPSPEPGMGGGLFKLLARAATALAQCWLRWKRAESVNSLFKLFELFTVLFPTLAFFSLLALSYRIEELNLVLFQRPKLIRWIESGSETGDAKGVGENLVCSSPPIPPALLSAQGVSR